MKPILKWVGGKTQLLNEIEKRIPKKFNNYFEPFIGGGAVCFNFEFDNASINDFNPELANLYNVIKTKPFELIQDLKKHKNDSEYYYQIRALDRNKEIYNALLDIEKASRIIFLNKTCFNGLYRVNSKGEFNVPFGKYSNPKICDEENLLKLSNYFKIFDIKITNLDFEEALKEAEKDDFVYLDPPYEPISETSSFTSYNANGFNQEEQKRLKKVCDELTKKGVKWLLSNSASPFILELYKDYNIEFVKAKRSINSKGNKRGQINEILIKNY